MAVFAKYMANFTDPARTATPHETRPAANPLRRLEKSRPQAIGTPAA